MNDVLFMVADTDMREAIAGFLEREAVHRIIGCIPFGFDARRDIKVAKGQNDPGLFVRANELLRPFVGEYRHAVVIVDEEWDGSPGSERIHQRLDSHLTEVGWPPPDGLSLVMRPEVNLWLWSDSPHSATALGWRSWRELRPALGAGGWLTPGSAKPARPKEAAEWALWRGPGNVRRSSALYRKVTSQVYSATRRLPRGGPCEHRTAGHAESRGGHGSRAERGEGSLRVAAGPRCGEDYC